MHERRHARTHARTHRRFPSNANLRPGRTILKRFPLLEDGRAKRKDGVEETEGVSAVSGRSGNRGVNPFCFVLHTHIHMSIFIIRHTREMRCAHPQTHRQNGGNVLVRTYSSSVRIHSFIHSILTIRAYVRPILCRQASKR